MTFEDLITKIGESMSENIPSSSPLFRLAQDFDKFNKGEWEDSDFEEVDREKVEHRLSPEQQYDLRWILYIEPLAPSYYKYKGVRIFGGNGWWTLEDGVKDKSLLNILNYIDGQEDF
jgi:hypothetical protein